MTTHVSNHALILMVPKGRRNSYRVCGRRRFFFESLWCKEDVCEAVVADTLGGGPDLNFASYLRNVMSRLEA